MDVILRLAQKYQLAVVEDAAHAVESEYHANHKQRRSSG
jgi:dTDP-4-amino-4,6-dideoxygalactose transaminase